MPKTLAVALAAAGLLSLTTAAALAAPPAPPAPPSPVAPPAPPAPPSTSHTTFGWEWPFHGEVPTTLDWRIEPQHNTIDAAAGLIDFELGYRAS